MKQIVSLLAGMLFVTLGGSSVFAQGTGHGHGNHGGGHGQMNQLPQSPGQEAFGAIAEIIAILRSDPATDWTLVDIDVLRLHLADMDALVMDTHVTSRDVAGGIEMTVSLEGRGGEAAGRMVPAHGPVMAEETGWTTDLRDVGNSLVWTVTSDSDGDVAKIRGLGFYGLMATGWHHQQHHLAIARGNSPHQHQ